MKFFKHLAIVTIAGLATLPLGGICEPASAEEPVTQPSAGSGTNDGGFRFTYPVRDSDSENKVYTEAPASPAPATAASSQSDVDSAPSPVPRTKSSTTKKRSRSSENSANDYDYNVPPPAQDPEQFVSSGIYGESYPNIGEGRFDRRPYRLSFALYEGYNSNVNAAPSNEIDSMYTQFNVGIGYDFGSSRLKLAVDLVGGMTYYYNNDNLQDDGLFPTAGLTLSANYAATPRLDLSFTTYTALLSQPNFTTSGAPNSYVGNYIISDSTLSAKYRWAPKFATITSYNPRIFYYAEQAENDVQGRYEQTVSQQFLFLWKPTTSLVAEYRFDARNYFVAEDLDSYGNFLLLGFDHSLNPRSTVTARAGVEQRFNQVPYSRAGGPSTDIYVGPFAQLGVEYAAGKSTILGLTSRYGTTSSGYSAYSQAQQFLLGLSASHRFSRRIAANAFFNYQNNYYNQPDSYVPSYDDNILNAGFNLSFQINRVWALLGGYAYTTLISDASWDRDYKQNIVYIGTELSF